MTPHVLQSHALYPRDGRATATRAASTNYMRPLGDPWPAMSVGDAVEVHDTQGWCWRGVVLTVHSSEADAETITFAVEGERTPLPLPEITQGSITLPNLGGHAHLRKWQAGDIVELEGAYWKVGKPRLSRDGGVRITYPLRASTHEAYLKRPGRMLLSMSAEDAHATQGMAKRTSTGEWLHITKVTSRTTTVDGGLSSKSYFGEGAYVTEARAQKINEVHPTQLAQDFRVAAGTRVKVAMPDTCLVLVPPPARSPLRGRGGERAAIDTSFAGEAVLVERYGDPDMEDLYIPYVTRYTDAALVKRVMKALAKVKS